MRADILGIICLCCVSCSNASIFKHNEIEEYIAQECKLEKNEKYEYCCVMIENTYPRSDYLEMRVMFDSVIMALEQNPYIYQSRYYPLYGKLVSICVETPIKEEILNDNVEPFDYEEYYASDHQARCILRVSSRARINKNTWQVKKKYGYDF